MNGCPLLHHRPHPPCSPCASSSSSPRPHCGAWQVERGGEPVYQYSYLIWIKSWSCLAWKHFNIELPSIGSFLGASARDERYGPMAEGPGQLHWKVLISASLWKSNVLPSSLRSQCVWYLIFYLLQFSFTPLPFVAQEQLPEVLLNEHYLLFSCRPHRQIVWRGRGEDEEAVYLGKKLQWFPTSSHIIPEFHPIESEEYFLESWIV